MPIRIHFEAEDLARTQVAGAPDPLWETLLSLHVLQEREGTSVFGKWRKRTRALVPAYVRHFLCALAPPRGYSPDFLTPAESANGLEAGLEALLSTSRERLGTDMSRLAVNRHVPERARDVGPRGLERLADAISSYHAQAIAPYHTQIRGHLEADRAERAHRVLNGGVEHLLDGLHPNLRWEPPVLEVRGTHVDRDVPLGGRGLRLVPSFFCRRNPVTLREVSLQPVLVYPVEHQPGWDEADFRVRPKTDSEESPCAALLGRTRAAALEVVASGCTTSELARRLNISPATATHHTAILREAGLITSHRAGASVHHTLGSLGSALLRRASHSGDALPAA
ncbi:winged helix-turn-helix transcriptional regulator [Streptomyces bathyalis]|uniref:Winged helix-turn-helix transcriptional regulator n=1 Tax=Streptomyces bathyalis TaxID=2710756 RepID=A0A7T1WS03_9ACTN|nr:winged helix-turn-helix domain-containing protein [Streptomyces bathyalis]QPP07089.1 winged helix-turn-helix transcriptional regulator [Streptomyces bathyalis]